MAMPDNQHKEGQCRASQESEKREYDCAGDAGG
jgi:hypothetical protein